MTKKRKMKKKILSPQRRGNLTSVVALQIKPTLDVKAALKSKIQDILSGRSRFVIRKVPAEGSARGKDSSSGGRTSSNELERVYRLPSVSSTNHQVKKDRYHLQHSWSISQSILSRGYSPAEILFSHLVGRSPP